MSTADSPSTCTSSVVNTPPPSRHTDVVATTEQVQSDLAGCCQPLSGKKKCPRVASWAKLLTSRRRLEVVGGYAPFGAINTNARRVRALAPKSDASLPIRKAGVPVATADTKGTRKMMPRDGLELRHALESGIFSYHFGFRRRPRGRSWSGSRVSLCSARVARVSPKSRRSRPSFPPQNCSTPSRATRKSISVRVRTGSRVVAGHSR
jgi:hypothetical protein